MTAVFTSESGIPEAVKQHAQKFKTYAAVVDINGRGQYHTVEDAVDAGHRAIYVRKGTYPHFAIGSGNNGGRISGDNPADTIIDGAENSHAVSLGSDRWTFENFQVKTTSGGGNTYDGFNVTGENNTFRGCTVGECDSIGFEMSGASENAIIECRLDLSTIDGEPMWLDAGCSRTLIKGNKIDTGGSHGIYLGTTCSDCIVSDNEVRDTGGYGINVTATAENCVIADNRVTGNSSGQILDSSGTSTVTGNNTT